ncbi:lipopolysaccharide transport periplasmic protein LptA [Halomonas sp. Bachu 37]|uniref:lipopolysaccharide transport periplasmic protein LptA n=1 Tax=Halomonas kashgarensis TaxID=3084920 RepID=UPI0032166344
MKPTITAAILASTLLTGGLPTLAFAQSSQAPIEVEADRLDLDQRAGTAVYAGNVEIRQGEMRLKGDRVQIQRNDEGELSRATATGERAYLRHQIEGQPSPMEGWARNIVFHVAEQRVVLIDQAELNQQDDHFEGGYLEYFIDRQVVQARSETGSGDQQRIRMTLQPERQ